MERKQEVSKAVIQRLPRYYRNICELKAEGEQRISSKALAERMGLTASQIRQDFNCFGGFGQQGYGYNIDKLQEELGAIMGLRTGRTAILLGAGNLGRALLNNFNFSASGFELLCAFDANPQLIGQRFGGHEQAAGLTIRAELVPELRRLLNRVIPQGDNCDLTCYIPQKEYELEVPLEAVNMALIDELNQLQPTGYGNPNPVLMARGLHVQEARRVGVGGAHLKLTLLDGANVRGGIGFQQGDLADRGYERVDVLFSPEVNEFRGQRTVQLNVAAMKQTGGSLLWPDEKMIFSALLQELTALASNYNTLSSGDAQAKILPLRTNQLREKLRLGRGVLMIAHQSAWAKDVLSGGEADTDVGQVRDARAFNTVLFAPDVEKLRDDWRDVVLLDGETLPGLKDIIRQKCPNARLWCLSDAPDDLRKELSSMTVSEDTLRGLYRRLLRGGTMAASALAQDCGMTEEQVLTGLIVFGQVALVSFKLDPYQLTLLPMHKVALTDSPLRKYLITHYAAETQM